MTAWVLIVTLAYGTPQAREVEAATGLTWADCIMLSVRILKSKDFKPPVAATCKPADVKA